MTKNTLDFLHNFFDQIAENSVNDQMMEYSYIFPEKGLQEYVEEMCAIPFADYIEYMRLHPSSTNISSDDVTQISSVAHCEIGFCKALQGVRRPLTNEEVGKLLQNDGVIRDSGANIKYGENHAKAAMQLGLAQNRYGYWYLSCLGHIFPNLSAEKQKALLCRCLLRNHLYANIFLKLDSDDVTIQDLWTSAKLSKSTQLRRRSSVRHFIQLVSFQASAEGYIFTHKLDFSIGDKKEIVHLTPPYDNNTATTINFSILGENYKPEHTLDYYLDCLSSLHVNRNGNNIAPHKYVLMSTILNLISNGIITINSIVLDDILESAFNSEWEKNVGKDSPFVAQAKMPFTHMKSEPFWREDGEMGEIDLAFFYYMNQPESSQIIRLHLDNLLNSITKDKSSKQELVKDLSFYKNQFLQMVNLVKSNELAAKMLIMLWATIDYVQHFPGERKILNRLPLLGAWEGLFLKRYNMFFSVKRNSTAFSTPFIHLAETSFWRILDDNDNAVDCDCRAAITFVRLSESYPAVEIDKELMTLFMDKKVTNELEIFFQRNIKILVSSLSEI